MHSIIIEAWLHHRDNERYKLKLHQLQIKSIELMHKCRVEDEGGEDEERSHSQSSNIDLQVLLGLRVQNDAQFSPFSPFCSKRVTLSTHGQTHQSSSYYKQSQADFSTFVEPRQALQAFQYFYMIGTIDIEQLLCPNWIFTRLFTKY